MFTSAEEDQFFRVMYLLQFFTNQRLKILPKLTTLAKFMAEDIHTTVAVRNALYENIDLIDAFVEANPGDFSDEDLEIALGWKDGHRVGYFFVERHLKKHSIWIGENGNKDVVYCVSSLRYPMEETIPKYMLPFYVEAVLLAFKGRVIYDGILRPLSISFGGGYRARLRETYLRAKQNGQLIESLDPGHQPATPSLAPIRNWTREVASVKKAAAKLKGEKSPMAKEAFAVCRESARLAGAAIENPGDLGELRAHGYTVAKALRRFEKVLDRAKWV